MNGSCARDVASRTLEHMIRRVNETQALSEPFGHFYLSDVLPADLYRELLTSLPDPSQYDRAAERHHKGEAGGYVRSSYTLTHAKIAALSSAQDLWRGVASALTAPELKRAVFAKLAPDLAYRFGVPSHETADLPGYSRPTLYRETEGFEIPPHPDTRKKVVTMHLYLPADLTQLDLGTSLFKRRMFALPVGAWQRRFVEVKRFPFRPNSAYAFVVNNTLMKRSWHGRERLREGAGVRNTLLNTFYTKPLEGYDSYLSGTAKAA